MVRTIPTQRLTLHGRSLKMKHTFSIASMAKAERDIWVCTRLRLKTIN